MTHRFSRDDGNDFIKKSSVLSECIFIDCIDQGNIIYCKHGPSDRFVLLQGERILFRSPHPLSLSVLKANLFHFVGAFISLESNNIWLIKKNTSKPNSFSREILESIREDFTALFQFAGDYCLHVVGTYNLLDIYEGISDWSGFCINLQKTPMSLRLNEGKYSTIFCTIHRNLNRILATSTGKLAAASKECLAILEAHRRLWATLCSFIKNTLEILKDDAVKNSEDNTVTRSIIDSQQRNIQEIWEEAMGLETIYKLSKVTIPSLLKPEVLNLKRSLDYLVVEESTDYVVEPHSELDVRLKNNRIVDFKCTLLNDRSIDFILISKKGTVYSSRGLIIDSGIVSESSVIMYPSHIFDFGNLSIYTLEDGDVYLESKLPKYSCQLNSKRKTFLCFQPPDEAEPGVFQVHAFE